MSADYDVPAETVVVETEVKKSRFITFLAPATSRADAITYIQSLKKQYPDASHHCSAFIAGPPGGGAAIAFDDDGEPSGTAGKPMLNVLQHKGVGEIVAVVVRYFGGTKLGAGGLVRAYGSAVQAAFEQLPLTRKVSLEYGTLYCDYAQEQKVRHILEHSGIALTECTYGEQVEIRVAVPGGICPAISEQLVSASRGQVNIHWET